MMAFPSGFRDCGGIHAADDPLILGGQTELVQPCVAFESPHPDRRIAHCVQERPMTGEEDP
jgi:hypothetical protein